MPERILRHGRRHLCPGASPWAQAVALDWGIFSQHFRGAFIQPLQVRENHFRLSIDNGRHSGEAVAFRKRIAQLNREARAVMSYLRGERV